MVSKLFASQTQLNLIFKNRLMMISLYYTEDWRVMSFTFSPSVVSAVTLNVESLESSESSPMQYSTGNSRLNLSFFGK